MGPNMHMVAMLLVQERERSMRQAMRVREADRSDAYLDQLDGGPAKATVAAIVALLLMFSGLALA